MLILIIAGGPDKGRIYELINDTEVVLGREGDKVQLKDNKCSRKHARLFREDDQWYVEDLGSRHGTHRNHKHIEGKTRIEPGDYLQVGSTVLVVGEMPTEHAERNSLIGDRPIAFPSASKPRTGLVVGSALAAAGLVVAVNVALHLSSTSATQQKSQQLASQLTAIEKQIPANQQAAQNQKLADYLTQLDDRLAGVSQEQIARDQVLGDILAAVSQKPESLGPKLEEILARIDTLPDPTTQLAAIDEAISKQPRYDEQLVELAKAIEALPDHGQKLDALAAAIEAQPDYARQLTELAKRSEQNAQMLTKLDTQLADGVRTDTQAVMARIDTTLTGMLDELKAQQKQANEQDAVMLALAQNQKHVDAMFTQVLDELKQRPTSTQMVADLKGELEKNWGTPSKKTQQLFTDLLAALENQPSVEELTRQFAQAQAKADKSDGGEATTELLRQIMAKVEAQESLAAQLEEVKTLVKAEQNNEAVDTKLNAMLAQLQTLQKDTSNNREVLAAINELRTSLPSDIPAKLDAALAKLDSPADRESLTALAREVKRLAEAQQASLGSDDLMKSVLAAAEARKEADAKLARIVELLDSQPKQTREAVEAALAKLDEATRQGGDAEALAAAIEQIRQGVRDEVRAEFEKWADSAALAMGDSAGDPSGGKYIRSNQPIVIVTQGGQPTLLTPEQLSAAAATPTPVVPTPEPLREDGLSETERAYKLAFETGKPVRVGGSKVNPTTGRITEGRLLDPAAARTAGITDWRDWYLMDDFAERMRLQRQAMRYLKDNGAAADVTKLPTHTEPVISASPAEQ